MTNEPMQRKPQDTDADWYKKLEQRKKEAERRMKEHDEK